MTPIEFFIILTLYITVFNTIMAELTETCPVRTQMNEELLQSIMTDVEIAKLYPKQIDRVKAIRLNIYNKLINHNLTPVKRSYIKLISDTRYKCHFEFYYHSDHVLRQ